MVWLPATFLLLAGLDSVLCMPRGQVPFSQLQLVRESSAQTVEAVNVNAVGYLSRWSSQTKTDFITDLRNNQAEDW